MDEGSRTMAFAVLLEHLESESMHMAKSIVEEEYSARYGEHALTTVRAAMGSKLSQLCPSQATDHKSQGKKMSTLVRLIKTKPGSRPTKRQSIEIPDVRPSSDGVESRDSPMARIMPMVRADASGVSQKSPNRSEKEKTRRRRRRRSSLAVQTTISQADHMPPLEPHPVPDHLQLDDIDDLVVDANGVVEGGSPLALLRWACRCAWFRANPSTIDGKDVEQALIFRNYSSDLGTFLSTFTDFTTPEEIIENLECMNVEYPDEAWGLQHFLLEWLQYDFYQLPLRTRRGIMESMIQIALISVGSTHHDNGKVVDVTALSKDRLVMALPEKLVEVLRKAEADLCVDERVGARHRRPNSSSSAIETRSPSTSISSDIGYPSFDKSGAMLPSPRSPSAGTFRKSPRAGAHWTPAPRSPRLNSGGRKRSPSRTAGEIFDFPVRVVAEQLTCVDSALFRKIPSLEFLNKSWDRKRFENVAEHTNHWIDRFNGMVEFMATLVLHGEDSEDRASRLEYLIDLGDVLWSELNNFMGASMIDMALEHLALKKIRKSWDLVPRKQVQEGGQKIPEGLEGRQSLKGRLRNLFSHKNNYRNYRMALSRVPADAPAIPAMIVHHKDLFDTHEGAPHLLCRSCGSRNMKDQDVCAKCKTTVDRNYRNFNRSRNLSRQMSVLRRRQQLTYHDIVPDREICNLISRGVQPHMLYFDKHQQAASRRMLQAGGALGRSEE